MDLVHQVADGLEKVELGEASVPANLYLEGSLFKLGLSSFEGRAYLSYLSSIPISQSDLPT